MTTVHCRFALDPNSKVSFRYRGQPTSLCLLFGSILKKIPSKTLASVATFNVTVFSELTCFTYTTTPTEHRIGQQQRNSLQRYGSSQWIEWCLFCRLKDLSNYRRGEAEGDTRMYFGPSANTGMAFRPTKNDRQETFYYFLEERVC